MNPKIVHSKIVNLMIVSPKIFVALMVLCIVSGLVVADLSPATAGEAVGPSGFKVLEPIRHGNLTVFPVVTSKSYPTGEFLTLDEGLRSGDVIVTEYGNVQGLIRRHTRPQGNARWRASKPLGAD